MSRTRILSLLCSLSLSGRTTFALLFLCLIFLRPAAADTMTAVNFPGAASTRGLAVNDNGVMAGVFTTSSGASEGYIRYADGTYSAALVDPGDNQGQTTIYGINNAGTAVGEYLNRSSNGTQTNHGFFLKNGVYTTFDVGGPVSTGIFAINSAGDFAGGYGSYVQTDEGFVDIGGVLTEFAGPAGNTGTYPLSINTSDVVVGRYLDGSGRSHGFIRNSATGILTTMDYPGAAQTGITAINDFGMMAGYYVDGSGNYHGFFAKGGVFTPFNAPGASSTAVVGLSNKNVAVGNTTDFSGIFHGFFDALTPATDHLLWTNTNGQASVWSIAPATGTYTHRDYGPYTGYTAKTIADGGTDGKTRMLWTKADGTASLWSLNTTTGAFTHYEFGPYTGYTAVALSVAADNTTHVLWTSASGAASIWNYNATGTYTHREYGPFTGYKAKTISDGAPDGRMRVLWAKTDGSVSLWSLDNNAAGYSHAEYGPYSGYTATAISLDADGTLHLLWDNVNGTASLWNLSTYTGAYTHHEYGPYSGWTANAVADGPGGKAQVLWNNTNGALSLWNLNNIAGTFGQFSFGPYPGYTAVTVSASP